MAAHLPRPCAVSRVGAAVTSFSANQRWKPAVPWAGEPTTAPPIPSVHWSKMTSADLSTESHGSRTRPFQRGAVVFAPSSRADTASGHATVNPPAPPPPRGAPSANVFVLEASPRRIGAYRRFFVARQSPKCPATCAESPSSRSRGWGRFRPFFCN